MNKIIKTFYEKPYPIPGQRIRFMFLYKGAKRRLLWIKVGKEGHIYFGTNFEKPSSVKMSNGEFDFSDGEREKSGYWGNEEFWTEERFPSSSRISWKSDGEIHFDDDYKVKSGWPISGLKSKLTLGHFLFTHPLRIEPAKEMQDEEFDFMLFGSGFPKDGPRKCVLSVRPINISKITSPKKPRIIWEKRGSSQSLAFCFYDLQDTPDLSIELDFDFEESDEKWPNSTRTLMIWKFN